mmetsp:Transcript_30041/g.45557  ORF Transcript_30041/g.45557 Transcript_30041/m.45557 type:complete len:97 (+) Transcript_30041:134-424(+)
MTVEESHVHFISIGRSNNNRRRRMSMAATCQGSAIFLYKPTGDKNNASEDCDALTNETEQELSFGKTCRLFVHRGVVVSSQKHAQKALHITQKKYD